MPFKSLIKRALQILGMGFALVALSLLFFMNSSRAANGSAELLLGNTLKQQCHYMIYSIDHNIPQLKGKLFMRFGGELQGSAFTKLTHNKCQLGFGRFVAVFYSGKRGYYKFYNRYVFVSRPDQQQIMLTPDEWFDIRRTSSNKEK